MSAAAAKRHAIPPGAQAESSPKRDAPEAADGEEEAAEGGKRRLVGALVVVDEELTLGQTLKNGGKRISTR